MSHLRSHTWSSLSSFCRTVESQNSRIFLCNRTSSAYSHSLDPELMHSGMSFMYDRLQCVMNAAARMLCSAGKYSHITGLIRDRLHWLPVVQCIQFKLCDDVQSDAWTDPAYLSELCASSCIEGRTRSSAHGDLVVQRTRTKFSRRAFAVAGPAAWNRLPCSVRNSPSLDSFKTALKTFLFTAST